LVVVVNKDIGLPTTCITASYSLQMNRIFWEIAFYSY